MSAETEVLVIDAPDGASALRAFRPQLDRTHLICRWPGELATAFTSRVSDYLQRLRRRSEVVSMTLVLGADGTPVHIRQLGHALALVLAPTASLTLIGAGASHEAVVASFEVLRQLVEPSVSLDVWFGPL
jgi:hypothetical protein